MYDQALTAHEKLRGSLHSFTLGACFFSLALLVGCSASGNDAHYSELEKHREQQKQLPAPAETETAATVIPAAEANAASTPNVAGVVQATSPNTDAQPAQVAQSPQGAIAQVNQTTIGKPTDSTAATAPQAATKARNYWTDFRGPGRDGRYEEKTVKTNWSSAGLPLLWRQPIGGGYASFVIAENRAYTIEQRRGQETVAAYNMENGRELWTNTWNAEFRESMGGDGPRATPTWHEGRLYALGAAGELRCLDAKTGKMIWSRNILTDNDAENLQWGMSSSPLIVDDKVITQPGGTSGKSIVAYNKLTGAPVWKVLNDVQSYTSPMLVTLAGKRQILAITARRIVGLASEDGSLLWDYGWANGAGINVSQPIVVDKNRVFLSAGYGKGAALIEVSGSGKNFTARKLWENNQMKNKFNSSVLHNGFIYGLDEGIMTCIDVATGERRWKGGRYGYGQVLLASNHLIVTTDGGEIVLVKATPDAHAEVAKFSALEGRTWNNPAIADGRLLVRNATQMACYNLAE
ncbi:MAG: PQQ-binding-like beta-propeller repeat protein [Pyrinomonadaceae bacterium MAG19_C2-C3]|nr:PQQ-binding-like beta-propeller repeat protein [Pyrinomonadaceae bacterium MAG19_C2-C3]